MNESSQTIAPAPPLFKPKGPLSLRPQCGANAVDMVGARCGRLVVIRRLGSRGTAALWLCQCDCGKTKVVSRPSLKGGYVKSCGCLYRESRTRKKSKYTCKMEPGKSAFNNLLKGYKIAARHRELEWKLSVEEFRSLISSLCFYCGTKPSKVRKVSRNGSLSWNGIDRIDNQLGYLSHNVVSCCDVCNHAKCNMSQREFMGWVLKTAEHLDSNRNRHKAALAFSSDTVDDFSI